MLRETPRELRGRGVDQVAALDRRPQMRQPGGSIVILVLGWAQGLGDGEEVIVQVVDDWNPVAAGQLEQCFVSPGGVAGQDERRGSKPPPKKWKVGVSARREVPS